MNATRTVFILKNHNGTFLAQHECYADLVAELVKYETQTGNETRVEVVEVPA